MRRPMLTKAVFLALGFAANAQAVEFATPLRLRLEVPATVTAGAALPLTFVLENKSRQVYWVLAWMTPLEGLWNDLFLVVCDGREIPYEGPMAKRGQPSAADFRRLKAGGSLKATIDLAAGYALPANSNCRIGFKSGIYVLPSGARPDQTPLPEARRVPIGGGSVALRVEPALK